MEGVGISSPLRWLLTVSLIMANSLRANGEIETTDSLPGAGSTSAAKPNIVFILADDMGFGDAPWNEKFLPERLRGRVLAPTLAGLAKKGVIFDQSYAMPRCTPSRAALMTGRYPSRYGLQVTNVLSSSPFGLPRSEVLLPEVMRDQGYSTHLVGKWHLGHCNRSMTPSERGFDSFFGLYVGGMEYHTHTAKISRTDRRRYPTLHNNTRPESRYNGWYATDLFTAAAINTIHQHGVSTATRDKPLFLTVAYTAPHAPLRPHIYKHYLNKPDEFYGSANRKKYLSMLYGLDAGVRNIVGALKSFGMWNNTLIIFSSDNGALPGLGLNYPLRGGKSKYFEGGTRVPMFAYHPGWHSSGGYRTQALVHITDWLPTLATVGGASKASLPLALDGVDFSRVLKSPRALATWPRQSMLYGAEGTAAPSLPRGAYRLGRWKVVMQSAEEIRGDWYIGKSPEGPPTRRNGTATTNRRHALYFIPYWKEHWALFDLQMDPYEEHNVLYHHLGIFYLLRQRLHKFMDRAVTPLHQIYGLESERGLPENLGGFWTHGFC